METTKLNGCITSIIKKKALEMEPSLLFLTSDPEFLQTYETLLNSCIKDKIEYYDFTLVEATVRKLINDKLIPNLIGDTTQNALNWIRKHSQ
jgi:hypothetical protein